MNSLFLIVCFVLAVTAVPVVDFHKVQTNSFVKMRPSGLTPLTKLTKPQPESGIGCEICKLIVGFVESDLSKNATVLQIEDFLETKVCTLFPAFLQSECNSTVEEYAPKLAQLIEEKLPAPVACAKIGLCSSLSKLTALVFPEVKQEEPTPESGILCEVCKLIVGFVESELGNNKTVEKIEAFLEDDVCKLFPSFLRPECNSTVAEYAPILAHYIEQKLPAPVVCSKAGLCSSSEEVSVTAFKVLRPAAVVTPLTKLSFPEPESGILCEVCKLIVGFVESELGENKTVASIEKFLEDDVCTLFPSFLRPECNSTVEKYAPILAKYIDQNLPANVVCQKTGLCSSAQEPAVVETQQQEEITRITPKLMKSILPFSKLSTEQRVR